MAKALGCYMENETNHLERLFLNWRMLEYAREGNGGENEEYHEADGHRTAAQQVLMNTAACLPAKTYLDLVYKLAIWRWHRRDLENTLDEMSASDAIIYSLFRDLVEMTGNDAVLTEIDVKTNLLRNPEAV